MSNKVNLIDLKRKEIRCVIYENDKKEIEVIYDNEKIEKLKGENFIQVYNPTQKQVEKIRELIYESVKENKIDIKGEEVIITLIPMLTNIHLELDKNEDMEMIKSIIEDPSDIFRRTTKEIEKVVGNVIRNMMEDLDDFSKLPSDIKQNIIEGNKEEIQKVFEETSKENKIKNMEEELKRLKEEEKNA